jgi:hypothetical protein
MTGTLCSIRVWNQFQYFEAVGCMMNKVLAPPFRWALEAFGVTNTPQFFFGTGNGTVAGVTLGSTSFGHVTSATGGRVLQLGAKFNF